MDEIKEAAGQFYAALNSMIQGDLEPMIKIWSHADDVTYLDPMGNMLVGWDQVLKSWEEQAKLKVGGKVDPENMHVVAGVDIGVTIDYERGTGYINGEPVKTDIRATNTFRNEDGKWKMIGHHVDLMPWLKDAVTDKKLTLSSANPA